VDVVVVGKFNVDAESGTVTALVTLDRERDGDFLQFHALAFVRGHDTPSHTVVTHRGHVLHILVTHSGHVLDTLVLGWPRHTITYGRH